MKELVTKKTNAVYDYAFVKARAEVPISEWMFESPPLRCREEYLETIHKWIHSTKLNKVYGLERFKKRHLINGTTQEFDEAYYRHKHRRLRIFRGEYAYHKRAARAIFIEDEPLLVNDYIIVSMPFCSTGRMHEKYYWLFERAYKLGVPVIVDCAYFGTCHGITFNFHHPAIESVAFSLSKGIGLGDIRSGIRYSNIENDNYPIAQQNAYDHTVLLAAKIGIHMMNKFSPDFIPGKYAKAQRQACNYLGIEYTPCMHLALGNEDEWSEHIIDGKYIRLGIRELVKEVYKNGLPTNTQTHHVKRHGCC